MKTILVTGATGFVGRAVCRALLLRGDRLIAAIRSESRKAQLDPRVNAIVVGEIDGETDWSHAFREHAVDTVLHLAARVHVTHETASDPSAAFDRINVAGTEHLARAAASAGVDRFIHISSLAALGPSRGAPLVEETPCCPITDYGMSKLRGEERLHAVAEETGLTTVILRPPSVYGAELRINIERWLKFVRIGWPLPLGSVESRRSLIFIENLTSAIIACIDHPRALGETFLVSDGESIPLNVLLRAMGVAMGRKARLIPVPVRLIQLAGRLIGRSSHVARLMTSYDVDTEKIRSLLHWQPPVSFEEGLKKTLSSFRDAA